MKTAISSTYYSWAGIIQRTTNPDNPAYVNYGARGIRVCKRWLKFESFLEDMGEKPTRHHTIERIKNHTGYSKSNCIWATRTEQNRNRRNNIKVTLDGTTLGIQEWADRIGVKYSTLWARYNRSWTARRMLCEPLRVWPGQKKS